MYRWKLLPNVCVVLIALAGCGREPVPIAGERWMQRDTVDLTVVSQVSSTDGVRAGTGVANNTVPEIVAIGQNMSAAARGSALLAAWFNQWALGVVIEQSLDDLQPRVDQLLTQTGQDGVVLMAEVWETSEPSTRAKSYQLGGGSLRLLGAGTGPQPVYNTYFFGDKLGPPVPKGSALAVEQSFLLWVARGEGGTYRLQSFNLEPLLREARRLYNDAKAAKLESIRADALGLERAMAHLEKAAADRKIREEIAALRASRDAAIAEMQKIETQLAGALEKERRAARTRSHLMLMADVLTLSQQVIAFRTMMQGDAPMTVNPEKPKDLLDLATELMNEAASQGRSIEINIPVQRQRLIDLRRNIGTKLHQGGYPTGSVPQIQGDIRYD